MKFDMNIKTKLTVSIGVLVAMIVCWCLCR